MIVSLTKWYMAINITVSQYLQSTTILAIEYAQTKRFRKKPDVLQVSVQQQPSRGN